MRSSKRLTPKRLALIAISLMLLYMVARNRSHKYKIENTIRQTQPNEVWNYVADFSKMLLLNPTILHFKVLSQSGNTHDFRYTVEYTERMSHWPYWLNTAVGHYVVTQSMPDVMPPLYQIKSTHKTCFFKGIYCLRAISDVEFKSVGSDTYCVENIEYECPPFLSGACQRELEYQRKAVMHNLTTIFSKLRH